MENDFSALTDTELILSLSFPCDLSSADVLFCGVVELFAICATVLFFAEKKRLSLEPRSLKVDG